MDWVREIQLTGFTDEDARTMAAQYLTKYRPGFLEAARSGSAEGAASTAIAT